MGSVCTLIVLEMGRLAGVPRVVVGRLAVVSGVVVGRVAVVPI